MVHLEKVVPPRMAPGLGEAHGRKISRHTVMWSLSLTGADPPGVDLIHTFASSLEIQVEVASLLPGSKGIYVLSETVGRDCFSVTRADTSRS